MFVSFRLPMTQLKRDRKITVYLPDDYYVQKKRYPVLYIQDGQNAFFDRQSYCGVSWGFLDYVKQMHLEVIMVAIPCHFQGFKRMDEYGPWEISEELSFQETHQEGMIIGGEGQLYVQWMIEELKPYIDCRFRTDVDDTAIVGSSMGGVISAYASLEYPEIFHKCGALSTAFWFYIDEFEEVIQRHQYQDIRKFYMDLGEFEGCGDEEIDKWYIESNNYIDHLLKEKINDLQYRYFEGAAHNEEEWRKRVPILLRYFYGEKNNYGG